MLSYAFLSLKQSVYEEVEKEEFEDLHNLFAAILAKGISLQLKQGLYREYLNREENITSLRGKIDINGTIKNKMARKQVLSCCFDELSENNLLNQILKTTVMVLMQHAKVEAKYKDTLKKSILFFSNVDTVDPATIRWTAIHFRRNNQAYRMLIGICQLILEGMLLTTEKGEYRLAAFTDEQRMCRLYEKFLFEYYSREYPHLDVRASEIRWALDEGASAMLPAMKTDVTLSDGKNILIIDAKYYARTTQVHFDVHTLHSANLYQIFTYVKNKDADVTENNRRVSGLLLYAKTDETIQPDNTYMMSGNRISVRTLDLNCDFTTIKQQLHAIIQSHFAGYAS